MKSYWRNKKQRIFDMQNIYISLCTRYSSILASLFFFLLCHRANYNMLQRIEQSVILYFHFFFIKRTQILQTIDPFGKDVMLILDSFIICFSYLFFNSLLLLVYTRWIVYTLCFGTCCAEFTPLDKHHFIWIAHHLFDEERKKRNKTSASHTRLAKKFEENILLSFREYIFTKNPDVFR